MKTGSARGMVCMFPFLAALVLAPSGVTQDKPSKPASSARIHATEETIRVEVNVVNASFIVTDGRHRLISGLPKDEFIVTEDGAQQDVRYFESGLQFPRVIGEVQTLPAEDRQPLLVTLMVDTSDSQRRFFQHQNEVASRFIKGILDPQDEAMLVSFDSRIDLVQDRTHSASEMLHALEGLTIGGSRPTLADDPDESRHTVLYDALVQAANRIALIPGRKAMIVLTDGEDLGSTADIKKAVEAVQRANIMVYPLLIADRHYYTSRGYREYHGDEHLMQLARETGGGYIDIRSKAKRLDAAFERIEQELRSQYSLGYVSSNQRRDGKFRKIRIRSRHGYHIQTRRGYYAPGRKSVVAAGKKPEL